MKPLKSSNTQKIFQILDETKNSIIAATIKDIIIISLLGGSYAPLILLYLIKPPGHLLVKWQNIFLLVSLFFFSLFCILEELAQI